MVRATPTTQLSHRLWTAVAVISGLVVFHQFMIQPALMQLTSDGSVINMAGRQRMLSQKLVKEALAIVMTTDPLASDSRQAEMAETLKTWQQAHLELRAKNLDRPGGSAEIRRGYSEIQPYFERMVTACEQLRSSTDDAVRSTALRTLLNNEPEFLRRMHDLVGQHERESRQHVRNLQLLGLAIMVAILTVAIVLQLGLLQPVVQGLGREWDHIQTNYRGLVESMTDGMVVFDRQGRVEFANQQLGDMLGRPVAELIGKPASLFLSDLDRTLFESLMLNTLEKRGPVDMRLTHASGGDVETMVSHQRMTDSNEEFSGLLLVVTDVTARKLSEERSRQLQIELSHADRLKSLGAMTAALAHEVNQPLGAISNYAEGCLVRLEKPDASPAEFESALRAILRAARRGAEFVRRSRSFVQRRPFQRQPEFINQLVMEVEELCRPEARSRGVTIELHKDERIPEISVDGIQIQQVLTNLIQNSLTALDGADGIRRIIRVATRLLDEKQFEVCVSDTGPGLAGADVDKLFDPFVTTSDKGTGLGLSIARSIVESHGGTITAANGQEGGAVFRIVLPVIDDTEQDHANPGEIASGKTNLDTLVPTT